MRILELLIPPPAIAFITALAMWLGAYLLPGLRWTILETPGKWWLVAALLLCSALFALPALYQFTQLHTTADPKRPYKTRRLAATGVYAYSRNPMYLGVLLLLLAWGVILANFLSLLIALVFPVYITIFQIRPEERYLLEKFGEEYRLYQSKVRRWL